MKAKRKYLLFIIPFIIELLVCNAKFWTFKLICQEPEESLVSSQFYAEGIEQVQAGGNTFRLTDSESGGHFLEFPSIGKHVRSMYLDLSVDGVDYISCGLFAKDDGDSEYYQIPTDGSKYVIVPSVKESRWFQTQFYGKLQSLRMVFDPSVLDKESMITVSEISINKPAAMRFSFIRVAIMELLAVLVIIFRKGSRYYGLSYADQEARHKACTAVALLANILLFVFMTKIVSPHTTQFLEKGSNHEEYQKLARAMAKGHVYLDDPVPDWLLEMENPYNTSERAKLAKETGQDYLWDNAYYNGHYYVYFGVVPVLLCYLPYYLIFHADLPNHIPILISWIVICIVFARLAGTVVRKWFPKFPYILYLLMVLVVPSGIGSVPVLQRPTIYEVPISMGLMFAVLGLDLWLESVSDGRIVSIPKVVAGSLCVALVAGCRPDIFAVFFFSFLIFGKFIIQDGKLCIHNYWKAAVAFAVPFLVVAAGLMYYNWIRFDSVFDFGSNYNLTVDDLTKRGFRLDRIGLGLFEFLWKPVTLTPKFPFIKLQYAQTAYMGKTTVWPEVGGMLLTSPFFLFPVAAFAGRKWLKRYQPQMKFLLLSVFLAVAVAILTSNIAGICPRYKADFGFFFAFAAMLAVCMVHETLRDANQAVCSGFQWVVFLVCLAGLAINFLSFFAGIEFNLWQHNPKWFYTIKYIFEFWR